MTEGGRKHPPSKIVSMQIARRNEPVGDRLECDQAACQESVPSVEALECFQVTFS